MSIRRDHGGGMSFRCGWENPMAKVPLHVQIPIKMVCFQTFLVASIFDLNIASHAAISK